MIESKPNNAPAEAESKREKSPFERGSVILGFLAVVAGHPFVILFAEDGDAWLWLYQFFYAAPIIIVFGICLRIRAAAGATVAMCLTAILGFGYCARTYDFLNQTRTPFFQGPSGQDAYPSCGGGDGDTGTDTGGPEYNDLYPSNGDSGSNNDEPDVNPTE